eukprot:scpid40222/ scgid24766/ Ephrin type-B receptor 1
MATDLVDTQLPCYLASKDVTLSPTARQLGAGSFGEVLEGRWISCAVAVKRLYPPLFSPDGRRKAGTNQRKKTITLKEMMSSFNTLIGQLCTVHHPHIADFYGVTVLANHSAPVLVSEQLHRNLLDRRRDPACPQLTVRDCVDVALQVSSALAYLHERNVPIVHGGVNSRNVLLSTSGRCKLTDVNLAKWFSEFEEIEPHESTYLPCGLSKEERFSCPVDVYALGVVLLEAMSGRGQFVAQDPPVDSAATAQQEKDSWETASNASQSSDSGRLSMARVRFKKYLDKLGDKPDLVRTVTVLLQPTRPRIESARKVILKLATVDSYLKSKSMLKLDVGYLASEVRDLREAVLESQERNSSAGEQLQDVVDDQHSVVLDSAEVAKASLYHIRLVQQQMHRQHDDMSSAFLSRLEDVHIAAHNTYAAMYNMAGESQARAQYGAHGHDMAHSNGPNGSAFPDTNQLNSSQEQVMYAMRSPPHFSAPAGQEEFTDVLSPVTSPSQLAAMGSSGVREHLHSAQHVEQVPVPRAASSSSEQSAGEDGYIEDEWPCSTEEPGAAAVNTAGPVPSPIAPSDSPEVVDKSEVAVQQATSHAVCVERRDGMLDDSLTVHSPDIELDSPTNESADKLHSPVSETVLSASNDQWTSGNEFESTEEVRDQTSCDSEVTPCVRRRNPSAVCAFGTESASEGATSPELSDSAIEVDELMDYFGKQQDMQTNEIRQILASHLQAVTAVQEDCVQRLLALQEEQKQQHAVLQERQVPEEAVQAHDQDHCDLNSQSSSRLTPDKSSSPVEDEPEETDGPPEEPWGEDDATVLSNGFGALVQNVRWIMYSFSQLLEVS